MRWASYRPIDDLDENNFYVVLHFEASSGIPIQCIPSARCLGCISDQVSQPETSTVHMYVDFINVSKKCFFLAFDSLFSGKFAKVST